MSALEEYAKPSEYLTSKFLEGTQVEDSIYSSSQTIMKMLDIDDNEITETDSDCKQDTNNGPNSINFDIEKSSPCWDITNESSHKNKPIELMIDSRLFGIEANKPIRKNNLMSILSGKQSDNKSKKKPPITTLVIDTDADSSIDEDLANSSFTDVKANNLKKEHDLIELERKFYKQGTKSVSSKYFLSGLKMNNENMKKTKNKKDINLNKEPQIVVDKDILEIACLSNEKSPDSKPILIISDDENETKQLESKVFSETTKRSSVRDLLKPLKTSTGMCSKTSKKGKDKQKEQTNKSKLFVTLKINRKSLAEIKKYENPLKTRGNFTKYIPPNANNGIKAFDMKSLSSNSFFQSMIDASKTEAKLNKYQNRVLQLPDIARCEYHVIPQERLCHQDLQFPLPPRRTLTKSFSQIIKQGDKSIFSNSPYTSTSLFEITPTNNISKELVKEKIPSLNEYTQLTNIYNNFILNGNSNSDCMLWVDFFQPKRISDVLISLNNQKLISNWISNAYFNLKIQGLKNPRNLLMKYKKQKQNSYSEMSDFIVDDFGDDYKELDIDTDVFIPLLIIHGSTGSCKSSSVYAYMNEIKGYVYEINSGQQRGKKDIFNNLKEFATTQLVHRQQESNEFQKGLVLFEDVNILYEQDKNFWQVIQEIINITRRPIVLTCDTLDSIPKSILKYVIDENSIINLDSDKLPQIYYKGLFMAMYSKPMFNLDNKVLDDILNESFNGYNYDLRKCLMKCQYVCSVKKIHSEIEYNKTCQSENSYKKDITLEDLALEFDMASISDVIRDNSLTQINHEILLNEFSDISYIDPSAQLKPITLPYEKNIGKEIQNIIKRNNNIKPPIYTVQKAREMVMEFVGSRAKKMPKILQEMQNIPKRQTRSTSSLTPDSLQYYDSPDTIGIIDGSLLKSSSSIAIVTELLPFSRDWLRFQVTLNQFEEQHIRNNEASIKTFLRYRDFYYDSKELLQSLNYYDLLNIIDNCK